MAILIALWLTWYPGIDGARAEVDCAHGTYTGYQYRYRDDPIVLRRALWYSHDNDYTGYYVISGVLPYCLIG